MATETRKNTGKDTGAGTGAKTERQPEAASVYQVIAPKEPMVKMLYIDSCIPNNQIPIGKGRVITGSGKTFSVTLTDFEGEFMTAFIQKLIKKRKIIVLDGVTEDMRIQYGCKYAEGEIIKNEGIFDYLLNCPAAEAERLFGELCPEHRELVARRFMEAFENGDNRLDRARIEALNAISKGDAADGVGAFTPILKALNEKI
ncbi:MAG: hypothetical protein DBX49_01185 [Clostridia bacterium]|nr:MAG: hypothetical protein DBX49_01185 [Clostridia bacterium]